MDRLYRTMYWNRGRLRAGTFLFGFMLFASAVMLRMPSAFLMTIPHPRLEAEDGRFTAEGGESLEILYKAEAPENEEERVFVLLAESENAGLERGLEFDDEGCAQVTDRNGQEIILHRAVRRGNLDTVDYWFTLSGGQEAVLPLSMEGNADISAIRNDIPVYETEPFGGLFSGEDRKASASNADHAAVSAANSGKAAGSSSGKGVKAAAAAVATGSSARRAATASNAAKKASASNAAAAEAFYDEDGYLMDGMLFNDLPDQGEEEQASEWTSVLKLRAGSGATLQQAVRDAEKNAEKRGDAFLMLRWKDGEDEDDAAETAEELIPEVIPAVAPAAAPAVVPEVIPAVIPVPEKEFSAGELRYRGRDITVLVTYPEEACIPEGAVLLVQPIRETDPEYDSYATEAEESLRGERETWRMSDIRLFDLTIEQDGTVIEPAAPVQVQVKFGGDEAMTPAETEDLMVVHFAESGTEVLGAEAPEKAAGEIRFETESFSVFAVTLVEGAKNQMGQFEVTGPGQFSYDDTTGVLTVVSGAPVITSREGDYSHTDRILVTGNAEITIRDLVIDEPANGAAITIAPTAEAVLNLEGTNTLAGPGNAKYAGLEVGWNSGTEMADLTIQGEGTLNVTGGVNSAGIGGSKSNHGVYGNITIVSGNIHAVGGNGAAGIGSSDNPNNGASNGSYKHVDDQWGVIRILGGTVYAEGIGNGAGIGGGNHCDSGEIVIEDGTVEAIGNCGIGSGLGSHKVEADSTKGPGYYFGSVTINGGTVTATASGNGAGIGGGMYADARVTITGGTVTAVGGEGSDNYHHGGAGIGGGYEGHSQVTITGGTVTAEGGRGASGIGSGASPNAKPERDNKGRGGETTLEATEVTIEGGTVTATGGPKGGAGIGGGTGADEVRISISGGSVTATGSLSREAAMQGGAGIGSGFNAVSIDGESKYMVDTGLEIEITGGSVTATGGWGASGIGSGAANLQANVVNIGEDAEIRVFADGTKFAIDTRILVDGTPQGPTVSRTEGRDIQGDILQGTFVGPYDYDNMEQDPRGLQNFRVINDGTGAEVVLSSPAGYRSFATTVAEPGVYTVYSEDEKISHGQGRYFSVCSTEEWHEENVQTTGVQYEVTGNGLSDHFYLFPVKSIVVEKVVQTVDGSEAEDLNTTLWFALKRHNEDGKEEEFEKLPDGSIWLEKIEIRNGKPLAKAFFPDIQDATYDVWEVDENGGTISTGTVWGNYILRKIDTRHGEGTDNNADISADQWTDQVQVINTYEPVYFELPATGGPGTELVKAAGAALLLSVLLLSGSMYLILRRRHF